MTAQQSEDETLARLITARITKKIGLLDAYKLNQMHNAIIEVLQETSPETVITNRCGCCGASLKNFCGEMVCGFDRTHDIYSERQL